MRTSIAQLDKSAGFIQYIPENLDIQATTSNGYKDPAIIDEELGIQKSTVISAGVLSDTVISAIK